MDEDFKISPKFYASYLRDASQDEHIERMINVFEDRTYGWFLRYAKKLNESDDEHCGFAVLKLIFSYFEMIEQYLSGKDSCNESPDFFKRGLLKVFPDLFGLSSMDKVTDILYKNARCGFYHSGMTKGHFFIRDDGRVAIEFKNGKVFIDRYRFTNGIIEHFKNYITELRNNHNEQLRKNFRIIWEAVNSGKIY